MTGLIPEPVCAYNFVSMQILSTDRLFLRTWEENDFRLARSLWGDASVMTFLGGPISDEKVREKMQAEMACLEKHGVQYCPIIETQSDEFVSFLCIRTSLYTP